MEKILIGEERIKDRYHKRLECSTLYADSFKRKGDRLQVRESLGKAIEILIECGADGRVGKYEKELAIIK